MGQRLAHTLKLLLRQPHCCHFPGSQHKALAYGSGSSSQPGPPPPEPIWSYAVAAWAAIAIIILQSPQRPLSKIYGLTSLPPQTHTQSPRPVLRSRPTESTGHRTSWLGQSLEPPCWERRMVQSPVQRPRWLAEEPEQVRDRSPRKVM